MQVCCNLRTWVWNVKRKPHEAEHMQLSPGKWVVWWESRETQLTLCPRIHRTLVANPAGNPGHLSPGQWHFLAPCPLSPLTRLLEDAEEQISFLPACRCSRATPGLENHLSCAVCMCDGAHMEEEDTLIYLLSLFVCISSVQLPWSVGEFRELKNLSAFPFTKSLFDRFII